MSRTPRLRPVALRDRPWTGLVSTHQVRGTDVPTVAAVRTVLHRMAERRPDHRLFCRADLDQMRWVPVTTEERAEWIDRIATAGAGSPGDALAVQDEWTVHRPGDPTFRLQLFPDSFAVSFAHVFGDYAASRRVEVELLTAALTRGEADGLVHRPPGFPIARALAAAARRAPRDVSGSLRARLPPASPQQRPWSPTASPAATRWSHPFRQMAPSDHDRLTQWRSRQGVSQAAVVLALFAAGLQELGGPAELPLYTLMDGRSTMPSGQFIEGNFVAAVRLRPADVRSPADHRAAIRAAHRSGRPVVDIAHAAAGQALPAVLRNRNGAVDNTAHGIRSMTVSYMANTSADEARLPLVAEPDFVSANVDPVGGTISAMAYATSQSLHIGCTVPARYTELAAALVELVSSAPLALLTMTGVPR